MHQLSLDLVKRLIKIQEKCNISIGQVSKLIPILCNKEKYVLHYRNLQLYMDLGLKVKNVHQVLEFSQSPLLKYIDFNTKKRTNTKKMLLEKIHSN